MVILFLLRNMAALGKRYSWSYRRADVAENRVEPSLHNISVIFSKSTMWGLRMFNLIIYSYKNYWWIVCIAPIFQKALELEDDIVSVEWSGWGSCGYHKSPPFTPINDLLYLRPLSFPLDLSTGNCLK
jgi:hypothetical protein